MPFLIARNVAIFALAVGCGGASTTKTAPPMKHEHDEGHHGHHHRFDDVERWTKVFDDPARDEWQKPDKVIALMRLESGMSVADIGAGTGYFEAHLAKVALSVLAIDVEPKMVQWMTDRAQREGWRNVTPKLGAPDDPKIPDASVQRVLVVDTWHHIDDRVSYAKKIHRGIAANGVLFIVDFTKESPHGPPPEMRLAPESIVRELEAAGFSGLTIHTPQATGLPYQYVVEGKKASSP